MRRIRRWMLNAVTVLSLLLCVGTGVLWVRSYFVRDGFTLYAANWNSVPTWERERDLFLNRGRMHVVIHIAEFAHGMQLLSTPYFKWWHGPANVFVANPVLPLEVATTRRHQFAGFELDLPVKSGDDPSRFDAYGLCYRLYAFVLPMWCIAFIFAVIPAIWLVLLIRRRGTAPGHCAACDYDLSANVSGVCPECGKKIAEAK